MHKLLKSARAADILLFIIIAAGLVFRLKGIASNHSFWTDEAEMAAIARDVVQGHLSLVKGLSTAGAFYQPLQLILGVISFKLFGFTEWAARIPIVLLGTLGIWFAYLLTAKLSTKAGGLLAAFLYAFFQMNLAISTQYKPYAVIETCFLAILYVLLLLDQSRKENIFLHIAAIITASISTLMHPLGTIVWLPYGIYLALFWRKSLRSNWRIFIGIFVIVGLILFSQLRNLYTDVVYFTSHYLFQLNNVTYLRELVWKNYSFIFLPSIFGVLFIMFKNKRAALFSLTLILTIPFLWTFMSPSHNLRYIVPFFALILVFFAIFWAEVGEILFHKKSALICLLVAFLLYAGGYKIIRKPDIYYTPNADFYGDVQIANYKEAFAKIKKKFPNISTMAIFNDIPGPQKWYLNQPVTAYFVRGIAKPRQYPFDQTIIYGTLPQFLAQKSKYPKGILIIEDWQSLMPEEIKQYAKKHMKREIRVEGLPQAQGDNWPIEVYSWGI